MKVKDIKRLNKMKRKLRQEQFKFIKQENLFEAKQTSALVLKHDSNVPPIVTKVSRYKSVEHDFQ